MRTPDLLADRIPAPRTPAGAGFLGRPGSARRTFADHLDNPRGLSPAPGGGLYLAEAGSGGGVCVAGGEQGQTCVGLTGSFDLVTSHGVAPKSFPDANPNAVLYSGGHRYVADAGANILVDVKRNGAAQVLAFFGVPAGSQSDSSVPTCVARGPDGALYVGELLGGFYAPGHARIWRVVPGHAPKVWATGLSTVQGCGFGRDGAFYATEFQVAGLNEDPGANPAGDVVRIDRHGQRTHLGVGKLFFPSGFAAGSDGAIYVSNCSIAPASGMGPKLCPTGGQVVRIR